MTSFELGAIYHIILILIVIHFTNSQSYLTTPELTTLDWWGASTADMRAETENYHPRAQTAGGPQSQLAQTTVLPADATGGADVVEIHNPQGTIERRVNGQLSSTGQPSLTGQTNQPAGQSGQLGQQAGQSGQWSKSNLTGAANVANTLSGAPKTVQRPDDTPTSAAATSLFRLSGRLFQLAVGLAIAVSLA